MGNWSRLEPYHQKNKSRFTQWPALRPFDGSFSWIASDKQVFRNKHAAADAVRHCGKMSFDDVRKKINREERRPLKEDQSAKQPCVCAFLISHVNQWSASYF